jgi:crossover junction endodeoxyribonuclease RuvC
MKILGIDPGLESTGFACLELKEGNLSFADISKNISLCEHGVIHTNSNQPFEEKLKHIYSKLKKLLKEIKPNVVVVEEIYTHLGHPKTGLKMGHIKGVIELAVSESGIKLYNFSVSKVKKALIGRGDATKEQVARMLEDTFLLKGISNLHESDALALALAYVFHNARKAEVK